MGVRAVLSIALLFVATVKTATAKGNVQFWRDTVTLTCPQGELYDTKEKINSTTFIYSKKGTYKCKENGETKYLLHVEGKACKNCFELDVHLFLMILLVDMLGTVILMIIIYRCTKKKSSAGPPQPSKAPPRTGGRAPPVPSPDYAPLNVQTRGQDTYSTVVNRMG